MQRDFRGQSHAHAQWQQRSPARLATEFLVGTLGVVIAIAAALFLMVQNGWMESVQSALSHTRVPSLPSLPETNINDVFQGIADNVGRTHASTTTLWQSGGASLYRGVPPGGPGRKD